MDYYMYHYFVMIQQYFYVRSHISCRWRQTFFISVEKLLFNRLILKNLKENRETESLKMTIYVSGGLQLLQMVLESETGHCDIKDVGS